MYISKGGGGVCSGFPCKQPAHSFAAGMVNVAVVDKLLLTVPFLWHLFSNSKDGSFLQARYKHYWVNSLARVCVWSGEQESKGVQVCLQPSFMFQSANFLCNYNKSQWQTHRMALSLCNYSINCPIFSPRKPSQFLPFSLLEKVVILKTIRQMHLKNLFCKQRVKRWSPLLFPSCVSRMAVCSKGGFAKQGKQSYSSGNRAWTPGLKQKHLAEKPVNTETSCQGQWWGEQPVG